MIIIISNMNCAFQCTNGKSLNKKASGVMQNKEDEQKFLLPGKETKNAILSNISDKITSSMCHYFLILAQLDRIRKDFLILTKSAYQSF